MITPTSPSAVWRMIERGVLGGLGFGKHQSRDQRRRLLLHRLEAAKGRPRAILGVFDVPARPRVPDGVLTFALPWSKFERMLASADQTFLTTESCAIVQRRIARQAGAEE